LSRTAAVCSVERPAAARIAAFAEGGTHAPFPPRDRVHRARIERAPAQAAPVLEYVVSTNAREEHPTASAAFEAWSAYQRQNDAWSVYARPIGGTKFRVKGGRRDAITGAIDETTLAYQSFTRRSIRFFDLLTRTTTSAPDAVNTDAWEYWPSLSGDLLLFGRVAGDGGRDLILYDLSTRPRPFSITRAGPDGTSNRVR
jgi:hypothetical protein